MGVVPSHEGTCLLEWPPVNPPGAQEGVTSLVTSPCPSGLGARAPCRGR